MSTIPPFAQYDKFVEEIEQIADSRFAPKGLFARGAEMKDTNQLTGHIVDFCFNYDDKAQNASVNMSEFMDQVETLARRLKIKDILTAKVVAIRAQKKYVVRRTIEEFISSKCQPKKK